MSLKLAFIVVPPLELLALNEMVFKKVPHVNSLKTTGGFQILAEKFHGIETNPRNFHEEQ